MQHHTMACAVTGANGYVGSAIARYLRQQGLTVYELRRTSPTADDPDVRPFFLSKKIPPAILQAVDVLIHCAYDFSLVAWKDIVEVNVQGSLRLFEAARQAGVKTIIFISSMSAFEQCRSLYGKAKLAVEKEAEQFGLLIIRPGLVYGDRPGGMVGALDKLVFGTRILPLVGSGNQVMYLAHEDDLGGMIYTLLRIPVDLVGKPIIAAHRQGRTFREILQLLASRQGKTVSFVPIPWQPIWFMLKTAEAIGLRPRLRSDSLISLLNQNPVPDFTVTEQLDYAFRAFP